MAIQPSGDPILRLQTVGHDETEAEQGPSEPAHAG